MTARGNGGCRKGGSRIRPTPIVISLAYLALTGIACVPMFTRPDSPLSRVVAVMLTLPWSVVSAIIVAVLNPNLLNNLVGIVSVIAVQALLNAVLIFWMLRKLQNDGRRRSG